MDDIDHSLRDRVVSALSRALESLPTVRAGWEGGSAAFNAIDAWSDIDLNFIVDDQCSLDRIYGAANEALEKIAPVSVTHAVPPGRYYQLAVGGDFLFVDLCLYRESASDVPLEPERHGNIKPLFDKGGWLKAKPLDLEALEANRHTRFCELRNWFVASQAFVRKAILRQKRVEAIASYWSYTLKPLSELLRMRFCPVRWDFGGMRYLDRDLPSNVCDEFEKLAFVTDLSDLERKRAEAEAWGVRLLSEIDSRTSVD